MFSSYVHSSKVGLELAPLMKAQPTGNPRKDPNTGYMMDAKLTSTDITKHAAQQTVQPWHSRENKSHYWTQLTGQVGQILETRRGGCPRTGLWAAVNGNVGG